jgi:heme/copper-type cytochrome/quinol oxidase subunit 1
MFGLLLRNLFIYLFFILIFVGVNITFFPLHFSGLQGYPRKYIDYSDVYSLWNIVSSFGSIIRIFALFVFIYIVYLSLMSFELFIIDDKVASSPEASLSGYVYMHRYQESCLLLL